MDPHLETLDRSHLANFLIKETSEIITAKIRKPIEQIIAKSTSTKVRNETYSTLEWQVFLTTIVGVRRKLWDLLW